MIPWSVIQPALLDLIKQISGLDCVWRDQPQGYTSHTANFGPTAGAICKLAIGPAITRGQDELRTSYDGAQPTGQELQDTAIGVRVFTLKILVECFDQNYEQTADRYAEQIRSRLKFRSSRSALNKINCAFVSTAEIQDLSKIQDNRLTSIASLDIKLSGVGIELDPERYPYIEKVNPLVGP